jgi:hypothetical protein
MLPPHAALHKKKYDNAVIQVRVSGNWASPRLRHCHAAGTAVPILHLRTICGMVPAHPGPAVGATQGKPPSR